MKSQSEDEQQGDDKCGYGGFPDKDSCLAEALGLSFDRQAFKRVLHVGGKLL